MLKWYIQASSYAYYLVALVALLFFIAGQASTNIWLSIWSNDATTSQGNDPDLLALRLGVYGGLGMTQGTYILVWSCYQLVCLHGVRVLGHDLALSITIDILEY